LRAVFSFVDRLAATSRKADRAKLAKLGLLSARFLTALNHQDGQRQIIVQEVTNVRSG
jgi:hypothetical protein